MPFTEHEETFIRHARDLLTLYGEDAGELSPLFYEGLYCALSANAWLDERIHSSQWVERHWSDMEMRFYLKGIAVGGSPGTAAKMLVEMRGGGDPMAYHVERRLELAPGEITDEAAAFMKRLGYSTLPESASPFG